MPQKAKYPVVRKFTVDTGGTSDVYVDVGQCLSMINHRLYRQGRLYRVRVSIAQPTDVQIHGVTTLPDTWWARRAYEKAKQLWMDRVEHMKKEAGPESVARWNDFKVAYDDTHETNFTSALKPMLVTDVTGSQTAMTAGNAEWAISELMDNDGNKNTFKMLGTSTTGSGSEFAIIDTYSHLLNINSPDPDGTGTAAEAYLDFASTDVGADSDLDDQGDYPPYNEVDFPQLQVLQGQLTSTCIVGDSNAQSGIQRLSTGYFDAPLGLLRITPGANVELMIEVQSGDYKGVEAPAWE
uniref:Uncharacterized protein n=1 Tax=uncultured marine virus TaxID=186617 RepID=S4TE44_9VIRU|nr:hypothetical protein [uncultured marine virus]